MIEKKGEGEQVAKLELSGIDLTFPLLEFKKSLKLIKLLGFQNTDIALNAEEMGRHLWTRAELRFPYENGRRLRELLEKEGLRQTDLFVFMGDMYQMALNHPDKEIRQKNRELFESAVEYAKACECDHMTILPGISFEETSMETAAEELNRRVALAGEQGITLAIEAHVGSVADTPWKVRNLLEMTPGLTLTLDYSHFIKNGARQSEIDDLIPFASHMHMRNASRKSTQTIFKESEIDYLQVIDKIWQWGFQGSMAIEFCFNEWEDQNRVDTIGETILLKEYIEKHWERKERRE